MSESITELGSLEIVGYAGAIPLGTGPVIIPPVFRQKGTTHFLVPPFRLAGNYVIGAHTIGEEEFRDLASEERLTIWPESPIPARPEHVLWVGVNGDHHYYPKAQYHAERLAIFQESIALASDCLLDGKIEDASTHAGIAMCANETALEPAALLAACDVVEGHYRHVDILRDATVQMGNTVEAFDILLNRFAAQIPLAAWANYPVPKEPTPAAITNDPIWGISFEAAIQWIGQFRPWHTADMLPILRVKLNHFRHAIPSLRIAKAFEASIFPELALNDTKGIFALCEEYGINARNFEISQSDFEFCSPLFDGCARLSGACGPQSINLLATGSRAHLLEKKLELIKLLKGFLSAPGLSDILPSVGSANRLMVVIECIVLDTLKTAAALNWGDMESLLNLGTQMREVVSPQFHRQIGAKAHEISMHGELVRSVA